MVRGSFGRKGGQSERVIREGINREGEKFKNTSGSDQNRILF